MHIDKSVGLIECRMPEATFAETAASLPNGLQVKKAFVFHDGAKKSLLARFPELEWAADCDTIFQDTAIQHVIISAPETQHRKLIGAALKAKKHVQIV